ncbi:MAG: ArgR family transcriptional regulator [Flavobacteriaceae bacterium]|jgi:transcriptional regulator of arginine metabolism|nr:ArgR family transcriptional regulator [Flavobacteriaceae bacterium]
MKGKKYRHRAIKAILSQKDITSQDDLMRALENSNFQVAQATLSRDIRELKILKVPNEKGVYVYKNTDLETPASEEMPLLNFGCLGVIFSGNIAVMKTRPGYAMSIASEIDRNNAQEIIGTVAGDDTIILIIKENIPRKKIVSILSKFTTNIQ